MITADTVWTALALILVIEGLLPFLSPGQWRQSFLRLVQLRNGQLRFFGLCLILVGLGWLWVLN